MKQIYEAIVKATAIGMQRLNLADDCEKSYKQKLAGRRLVQACDELKFALDAVRETDQLPEDRRDGYVPHHRRNYANGYYETGKHLPGRGKNVWWDEADYGLWIIFKDGKPTGAVWDPWKETLNLSDAKSAAAARKEIKLSQGGRRYEALDAWHDCVPGNRLGLAATFQQAVTIVLTDRRHGTTVAPDES